MAQSEFVPVLARDRVRPSERLPPPGAWIADRPGELKPQGGQPTGPRLGVAGPDQGYALKLFRHLRPRIKVGPREHVEDAVAGCLGVALARAALYGRAPVAPDVELSLALWGFLDAAPPDLVAFRRPFFEGVAHDPMQARAIADRIPEPTLRMTPADVRARLDSGGWQLLLGLDG